MVPKSDSNVKSSLASYGILIFSVLLLTVVDQLTKYLVVANMDLYDEIPVAGDVFVLRYVRNTGTLWSLLSGKTVLLAALSIVILAVIIYIYHNVAAAENFGPVRFCLILLAGGAVGNMIDRLWLGYVIDFLYFKLINFPVFNFADICVTVGAFLLLFLLIFKYKSDEDMEKLFGHKHQTTK